MKLSGNTVLVTGGSSGIGLALAEAFLAAGSEVLVCARHDMPLREAKARLPGLHTTVCDVADEAERRNLVSWVQNEFPRLNVLVNNAGIQRDVDLSRGLGEFLAGENEIRINLEAPILLTGMLAPLLGRNPDPAVINVSSGLGFVQSAAMPLYSASKAGMHGFSMAIRKQFERVGIKVFEVVPPPVDTHLNPEGRAKRAGYKPALGPREFAAAVMEGLRADVPEIGYGMTAGFIKATRPELDRSFKEMNARM